MSFSFNNIHPFSYRGSNFLFCGGNLKICEMTDSEKNIINMACALPPDQGCHYIEKEQPDLYEFLRNEQIIIDEVSKTHSIPVNPIQEYLVSCIELEVANDCNMRCKYCYSEDGSYGAKREWMTKATAEKCIDFLFDNCGTSEELAIVFFGGEPLMNFSVVRHAAEYATALAKTHNKKLTFTITTNATLLTDEIINFFNQYQVSVTVSIDGPNYIQDKNRVFANGKGSYEIIEPKLKALFAKYKGSCRARATISNGALNLSTIERHFDSMGFHKSTLSFVDTDEESEMYIPHSQFNEIYRELEIIADNYLSQLISGKKTSNTIIDASIGSLYSKLHKRKPCGAGTTNVAFTASGSIYPCHRFSNMESYKLGDCHSGWYQPEKNPFYKFNINNANVCKDCYMKNLCGGSCLHTAVTDNGDINSPSTHYCAIYKKILELSIYIYSKAEDKDPEIFDKRFKHFIKRLESAKMDHVTT